MKYPLLARVSPKAMRRGVAALIALSLVDVQAKPPAARPLDCLIQPSQIVQVGTATPGVIDRILVDRGDMVSAGQTIVKMQADVERAALAVAHERARQKGEITVAVGAAEFAKREAQRAKDLRDQNFVSQTFYEKQDAEAKLADGRTDQAAERVALAKREVELARAQLAQRSIAAPIDGVVVERYLGRGELVDQKPILRIAAIDPLRVDVLVPAAAFGQLEPGMKGTVLPELGNRQQHVALVKTVDRVIDAATNTFRVRLELPNPGGALPPGLRCKVELAINLPELPAALPMPAAAIVPVGVPAAASQPTPSTKSLTAVVARP